MGLRAANPTILRKPSKPLTSTTLRRLSAESQTAPPPTPPPEQPSSSSPSIPQIVSLLQTTEPNDWTTNSHLHDLLLTFRSPSPLLKISRQLGSSQKTLHFFNFLNSPHFHNPSSLSVAFQSVLEHAFREDPDSPTKLYQLFTLAKAQNVRLSVNSTTLLIRCFGRSGMFQEMRDVYNEVDPDVKTSHLANLFIDLFLKGGRIDDAFKVLDEMLEGDWNCPPNRNTLGIVLTAVLRRDWSGRSMSLEEIYGLVIRFGKCGVFPDNVLLSKLMTKFCRSGDCDKAWDLLHEMMRMGGEVEAASCNALLTGLGKEHKTQRMNLLMNEMKEKGIQPDVVTFGILINHLCKFRRVDDALEVYEQMTGGRGSDGFSVQPDVVLYNTLIDGLCKVGRQDEGMGLMEKMKSNSECVPNTVTYNCLIDGFCRVGEIETSIQLFDRMNEEGVAPNVITVNTLLGGMCKHGRIGDAMDFFHEMQQKGLKGNTVTYTILITAFCNANNTDKAMKLFEEMLENECSPDATVYYSLISGLSQSGRLDDASSVVSRMTENGFRLDIISYNTLISGYCRKNKLDKAYDLLKDMEEAGVNPDRITYNTLISFFSGKGDFETANNVMKKMIGDGFVPNVVTYGALIHAYCLAGNLDTATRIFRDMSSTSKVQPNTVIYNTLINTLCKSGEVETALSLLDEMKPKGVRPNTTTFNAMLRGLQEKNWLDKAFELMDQMTENGCQPDYITMEILTEWLSAAGETQKLRDFVRGYEVSASVA